MKNLEIGHQTKEQNKAPIDNPKEMEIYKWPKNVQKFF